MRITAAVSRAISAPFALETVDLVTPRPDEIRVRLMAAGICHTDMAMRDHLIYPIPHPAVFGHEGAGVIEAVGQAVTGLAPGDHVVTGFGACHACPSCRAHRPSYCSHFNEYNFHGRRPDGTTPLSKDGEPISIFAGQSTFATYLVCPARDAVLVPRDLPFDLLAPLGCAVQTGAGAVLQVLGVRPGQSIAIFGTGSVGLCALMAARMADAGKIIAVDRNPARLALARELGATHVINTTTEDVASTIAQISPGGVDCSFETTASLALLRTATDILARRGTCGFVGGIPAGTEFALDLEYMMTGGRTLRGIILGDCDPHAFIPRMAEAIRTGAFPLDRIVTRYPFAEINRAVADSESGATIKAVLIFAKEAAA